jgi:hypothetical protein
MVLVMWGFGLLMAFGLPKIATPTVLDIVWMLLVGHQVCLVYEQVCCLVLLGAGEMTDVVVDCKHIT